MVHGSRAHGEVDAGDDDDGELECDGNETRSLLSVSHRGDGEENTEPVKREPSFKELCLTLGSLSIGTFLVALDSCELVWMQILRNGGEVCVCVCSDRRASG